MFTIFLPKIGEDQHKKSLTIRAQGCKSVFLTRIGEDQKRSYHQKAGPWHCGKSGFGLILLTHFGEKKDQLELKKTKSYLVCRRANFLGKLHTFGVTEILIFPQEVAIEYILRWIDQRPNLRTHKPKKREECLQKTAIIFHIIINLIYLGNWTY